jgi:hypothetical protein
VLLDEVEVSEEVSSEELHKPVLLDEVEVKEEVSNEESHKPVLLDEVEVREEVIVKKEPEIKTINKNQKPEKKLSKTKTPKTISRISTEEDGTISDDEVTEKNMYKESKLFIYQERKTISPEKTNEKLNKKQQDDKTDNDNNFDIFDIFETK